MIKKSPVDLLMEQSNAKRNPYVNSELKKARRDPDYAGSFESGSESELVRICKIPIRRAVQPEEVEPLSKLEVDALAYADGFRLHPEQLEAILEYDETGGLIGQIRVGGGKTIISVMLASRAFAAGREKILLLVPSSVYLQLVRTDLPFIRPRIPMTCSFFGFGGKNPAARKILAQSGPGCYIMTYGLLSQKDARDILHQVNPDLIICDEAQNLKHRTAARTKRVLAFLEDHPGCQFAAMSGTLTSKSIKDYQHLARYALREGSPLPISSTQTEEWSGILDAAAMPSQANSRKLTALRLWASKQTGERIPSTADGYRKAYQIRLGTTPGVVLSGADQLGTSLLFQNLQVREPGDKLLELIKRLNEEWITPNGDELTHAILMYQWQYALTSGFYNSLVWPKPENMPGLTLDVAKKRLAGAMAQHHAHNQYNKLLRSWLDDTSIPGLDTPMLVANNIARGNKQVPDYIRDAYHIQDDLNFRGMPTRMAHSVRVDDFKVMAALDWAKGKAGKGLGGIIWCYHNEMLAWLTEVMTEHDLNPLKCNAGDAGTKIIIDPANADRLIIAGFKSHGIGKNLQHFQHQIFVQWPRPAIDAEQTIGRTHRHGQQADELVIDTMCWTPFDQMVLAACLNDALYAELTTGVDQKVLYGTYNPPPIVFSSRMLQSKGFENQTLAEGSLESRFANEQVAG